LGYELESIANKKGNKTNRDSDNNSKKKKPNALVNFFGKLFNSDPNKKRDQSRAV